MEEDRHHQRQAEKGGAARESPRADRAYQKRHARHRERQPQIGERSHREVRHMPQR